MMLRLSTLFFLGAVAICSTLRACAVQYSLGGTLRSTASSISGKRLLTLDRGFELTVSNCTWYMRLTNAGAERLPPNITFWEVASDGRDVFWVDHYDNKASPGKYYDPRKKQLIDKPITISPQARVDAGPVPHYRMALASYVWLAFASRDLLRENSTGRLRQVWNLDDSNLEYADHTLPARWALSHNNLSFPQSITFYNEGTYFANLKGRSVRVKAPFPFANGWTNAIYQVAAWTNLDDLVFPLRATFARFAPRLSTGVSSNDLALINSVDLDVTWCSLTNAGEPHLPSLKHLSIVVRDNRFRPTIAVPITYVPKTGWLSIEEVKALTNFSIQYRYGLEDAQAPSRSLVVIIAYSALILIIVLPFILWIGKALKNRQARTLSS